MIKGGNPENLGKVLYCQILLKKSTAYGIRTSFAEGILIYKFECSYTRGSTPTPVVGSCEVHMGVLRCNDLAMTTLRSKTSHITGFCHSLV